jgi:predicted RND superfamily exporter protein
MRRTTRFIERSASWIVALAALLSIAAGLALPGLRIEHSQDKYAPPHDDPVVRSTKYFRDRFGAQTLLVAGLEFDRSIGAAELRVVQRVTRQLRALPRVASVFGLADVRLIRWSQRGPRAVRVLNPDSVAETDVVRLKQLVENTPLYRRGLVSSDWRMVGLIVELEREESVGREARQVRLALQVDSVLRAESRGQFNAHLTGMPLLNGALQESARHDVRLYGWLTVLIVTVILLLLFRHWRPVVLAGVVAAVALTWTLGLLAATGTPMSASLTMMVPLILVLSLAYSVHYLTHFYGGAGLENQRARFRAMMEVVFPPSVLTGLTTTAGFIALATSGLESVRETGVFLAAGVLLTMVASSVLLPALLSLPLSGNRVIGRVATLPRRMAVGMAAVVCRRAGLIVAITVVLVTVATAGIARLRFDANPLHFFSRDNALRISTEIIDERLGGSLPIGIIVQRAAGELDALIPAVLRVEERLRKIPQIGFVGSAVDFVQLAETARPRIMPPVYDVTTGRFPADLWSRLAVEPGLRGYVVHDSSGLTLRISCRARVVDSDALRQLVADVARVLESEFPEKEASVTGLAPLLLRTQQYMVCSQVSSFGLAFLLILALVFPVVRSWRVGGIAAIANMVPLAIVVGTMGWLGIAVDIASIMIASIALGVIVDDTIHFLYRYRISHQSGLGNREAIEATYAVVGTPLLVTSVVFIGGFLALTPSAFQPTSIFGLLTAITIATAFVADLLLLPALLVILLGKAPTS